MRDCPKCGRLHPERPCDERVSMSELRDEIERWPDTMKPDPPNSDTVDFFDWWHSEFQVVHVGIVERLERLLRRLDRFAVGSVGSGVRQPQDQRILAALRDDLREGNELERLLEPLVRLRQKLRPVGQHVGVAVKVQDVKAVDETIQAIRAHVAKLQYDLATARRELNEVCARLAEAGARIAELESDGHRAGRC